MNFLEHQVDNSHAHARHTDDIATTCQNAGRWQRKTTVHKLGDSKSECAIASIFAFNFVPIKTTAKTTVTKERDDSKLVLMVNVPVHSERTVTAVELTSTCRVSFLCVEAEKSSPQMSCV